MTSRFITYPDIVDSTENHPVLLVDANQYNIEDIALFCKVSDKDFDIYLYKNDLNDLEWLSAVADRVEQILKSSGSSVTISPDDRVIEFGLDKQLTNPLGYFQQYNNE
jgi:hypothetical protein